MQLMISDPETNGRTSLALKLSYMRSLYAFRLCAFCIVEMSQDFSIFQKSCTEKKHCRNYKDSFFR